MLPLANYCLNNTVVHELAHNKNPKYKVKVHMKCDPTFTFCSAHLLMKLLQKGVEKIVNSFYFFILHMTFEWIIKDW